MFATVPDAGKFGFVPDAAAQELPPNAWTAVSNVRFREGYAERHKGSTQVFSTPSVTPYWLTSYRKGSTKFWVHAGIQRAYCDDGSTRTDLTPAGGATLFTGAVDDRWTGGTASGILVMNNGVDRPVYWDGNTANDFANISAWDTNWRCASMRPFKQYIVALDVTKSGTRYPHMVKWSCAAVPGALPTTWDAADATKDAGEQDLAETTDLLVDQLPMGDINVIYKERSMYGMQYIGAPFVWRFYRLPGEVGLMARGCVADTPKGHVLLTGGDIVLHSGNGPQSIATGRVRRWLFNSIDTTYYARSFVCSNYETNEVWVCFPESGSTSCTKAAVWNWNDDTWSVRTLQNATYGASGQVVNNGTALSWSADSASWSSDSTSWSSEGLGAVQASLLMTQTDPMIVQMEYGNTFGGTSPNCSIERTGLAFGQPDLVKTVKSITPRIEASPGTVFSISVGASMDAEVQPTWQSAVSYTAGTTRKANAFATGRFLALKIESTATTSWRLKSVDFELVKRGEY